MLWCWVMDYDWYLVTLSITFEAAPMIKNNPSELRVKLWAIFRREKCNLLYGLFFTSQLFCCSTRARQYTARVQSCRVYQYPLPRASQFIRECETIMWFPMLAAVVSYLVTLEQTIRWIIRGNWWIINHSNEKQLCTLTQLFVINSNPSMWQKPMFLNSESINYSQKHGVTCGTLLFNPICTAARLSILYKKPTRHRQLSDN